MAIYTHKNISALTKHIPNNSGIFVIIDKHLSSYFSLFHGLPLIKLTATEQNKSLETVAAITNRLLKLGADRDCFIIGVGGGITTDIAGFVASIYKRGVRFGFVPTTLLAQADAALGGKNGVNFDNYKNIIGNINQPMWVYETPVFFPSLPPRVFREGIAEVLKTFLIFDAAYYKKAVKFFSTYNPKQQSDKSVNAFNDILAKCGFYKSTVVSKDEFERGERRKLNFGHTFAHAIEKYYNSLDAKVMTKALEQKNYKPIKPSFMHGEAVSVGIVMAAMISKAAGHCTQNFIDMLQQDFQSVGLPVDCKVELNKLLKFIRYDKKVSGHRIHFIMPYEPGHVEDELISLNDLYKLAKEAEKKIDE
ncbi:MAG: 3-dehydroquinate synthase [Bacteroidales bacterium]|nr:3-dehydroquinate synthase [Bacteroidales bacterium]MDD3911783.1 3-dehydroquinate synthase [Bacteroidales bacterium]